MGQVWQATDKTLTPGRDRGAAGAGDGGCPVWEKPVRHGLSRRQSASAGWARWHRAATTRRSVQWLVVLSVVTCAPLVAGLTAQTASPLPTTAGSLSLGVGKQLCDGGSVRCHGRDVKEPSPALVGRERLPPVRVEKRVRASEQAEPPVRVVDATMQARVGSTHGVGFTAGLVSGLGFAYRKHFENNFGVQIGGIGWGSKTDSFVNLGVAAIRTVRRSGKVRFYGLAAASVFRSNGRDFDYRDCAPRMALVDPTPAPCVPVEGRRTTGSLNFGVGIGLEFTPSEHVGLSFELPLSLMLDLEKNNRFARKGIYPIPGVSLIYYF